MGYRDEVTVIRKAHRVISHKTELVLCFCQKFFELGPRYFYRSRDKLEQISIINLFARIKIFFFFFVSRKNSKTNFRIFKSIIIGVQFNNVTFSNNVTILKRSTIEKEFI